MNLTIDIGLYNAVLYSDTANRGSYVASVIEEWVWTIDGWYWQGKTEVPGGKLVPLALCPPQIPHRLTPGIEPACP
jgi:hypothetical protein